jgi:hypothetical protein
MADIVQSLFGVTPELYQQAQAQRASEQALQYAQLSPFQQANYAIGRGGYQLAGALGGTDPQLQMISTRNSIAKQIDYNDPNSIMGGVQMLSQAGDTDGAMQVAHVARKMQSQIAQTYQRTAAGNASLAAAARERTQATPEKIQLARELASRRGAPGTPEYEAAYDSELTRLTTTPESNTPEMRNAAALAAQKGAPGSPEYNAELQSQLIRLTSKAETKEPTTNELTNARTIALQAGPVGSPEYNAAFMAEYNRLTGPKEVQAPDAVRQYEYAKTPAGGSFKGTFEQWRATQSPKVEVRNIIPGDKNLGDIPKFRRDVQATIDPQLKAINSSDQALQAINDSLATGNFVSFNAARVQLAKALGDSQLSRRDVEQAGGDPSILGGLLDATSRLFFGTPTPDTQKKIRDTLTAIRTVAAKKANAEVDQQRKIALRSPGYDPQAVNEALNFSELAAPAAPAAAAQAPVYARNPTTGQRIMSTDGGATWAPAPAAR